LRISDILDIQIDQIIKDDGSIRDRFEVIDKKTGKRSVVYITNNLRNNLELYIAKYPWVVKNPKNYFFFTNRGESIGSVAMSAKTTWVMIKKVCKCIWLDWEYGNHSLRKTWWFHARKNWVDLGIIQEKLNHSSLSVTKRYLWITDAEVGEVTMGLDL